ncbi:Reverse transcriptase domain-containing protein, partial [Aphis craccivora]
MSASSPFFINNDKFRKLIDMFNDLKISQNKIMSCRESIKSQDKKLASFDSKFDLLSNQIVSVIEESVRSIKINQIVRRTISKKYPLYQSRHFFSEFMDRQSRTRISTKPLSVHRLGKPSSKPRPIRIVMPSPTRDVITRGGGVLIAVKSRFSCRRLPILDNSDEQLFIQISEKSLSLVIGAVYIPLASDINVYDIHFNAIDVLLNNNFHSKFLNFGDYNLQNISWKSVN